MMQSGELAGCVVTDEFIRRLETEKKPQRLERAALMVAAVRDLGFAGAHIGGFGLTHRDFLTILERARRDRQRTGGSGWMSSCSSTRASSTCCPRARTGSAMARASIRPRASGRGRR